MAPLRTITPAAETHRLALRVAIVTALLVTGAGSVPSPPRSRPTVVLITVDTLRADHLGLYGYPRPTAPNLDRLAASATVFEDARAQVPKTNPSLASLMTGLYPQSHRLLHLQLALPPAYLTLAERLQRAGYATAAVVGQYNLVRRSGLAQGFDTYHDEFGREPPRIEGRFDPRSEKRAADLVTTALAWLQTKPAQPFFLWLHFMDPHAAYDPPPDYREMLPADYPGTLLPEGRIHHQARVAPHRDLGFYMRSYDAEIRYFDHELGRLIGALESQGILEEALLVVTADHGEYMGDRDAQEAPYFSHGITLSDGETRVPLLIKLPRSQPDRPQRRVSEPVQLVDVVPTLVDLLGLAAGDADGRSLAPLLRGQAGRGTGYSFSYSYESNSVSIQDAEWKLVFHPTRRLADYFRGRETFRGVTAEGRTELFARRGVEAGSDVGGRHPDVRDRLKSLLFARLRIPPERKDPVRFPISPRWHEPELEERLRALGYL